MRLMMRSMPSLDIGVAIGPERVTAVRHGQGTRPATPPEPWSRPLDPKALSESVGDALPELQAAFGVDHARLWIALLPPLVELKRLDLPRLARDELERVVARDASRYFLIGAAGPAVVALRIPRAQGRAVTPMLAAVAPVALLEQLQDQVVRLGWSLERIVPAHVAWADLACRMERSEPGGWVAVASHESLELLRIEDERITAVRRMRLCLGPSRLAAEVAACVGASGGAGEPELLVLAAPDLGVELTRSLVEHGLRMVSVPPLVVTDPHLAAALSARGSDPLDLVPPSVAKAHRRRASRVVRLALGAAAALLLMAGGVEWWGVHRELDHVTARRRAIRAEVVQAMGVRSAIEDLDHRVSTVRAAEAGRPMWAATMATLASALPPDAHLIAWRGDADSLRVEGLADRAAGVFEGLAHMPGVAGVRADAPIRQETRDSAPPLEHFLLSARLGPAADTGARR